MIDYRKATLKDAEALAQIRSIFLKEVAKETDEHGLFSESENVKIEAANKAYFEAAIANDSFAAWLAIDGGKIIGTSGLSFSLVPPNFSCPDGRVAYIMNIFTLPEYRKQGIGMELFKKVMAEAESRGYKKITLNATDAGRPLYERYGFKDVKGDMVFYITG